MTTQRRNAINLTPRQMTIARLSAQGHTPEAIAVQLGIASSTVRLTLRAAYDSTGFSGARSGIGLSYAIGVFDAGRPKTARQLCPALRDDAAAEQ